MARDADNLIRCVAVGHSTPTLRARRSACFPKERFAARACIPRKQRRAACVGTLDCALLAGLLIREQVNSNNNVATFTGAYDSVALFSQLAWRRARARSGAIRRVHGWAAAVGGLLALVVCFAAPSEIGARSDLRSATSSDALSFQPAPLLQTLALRRVADEPGSQRRPTPHVDSPFVADASSAEARLRAPVAVASVPAAPCAAGLSARGYDATAPPFSCV